MKAYREEVFIIEWYDLPQEQKELIYEAISHRFHNDTFIKWPTEFEPFTEEETFDKTLTMDNIESYWKDQCMTNNYKSTLDDFIKEYGLEFDIWIIKQNFDLTGIKKILIKIEW